MDGASKVSVGPNIASFSVHLTWAMQIADLGANCSSETRMNRKTCEEEDCLWCHLCGRHYFSSALEFSPLNETGSEDHAHDRMNKGAAFLFLGSLPYSHFVITPCRSQQRRRYSKASFLSTVSKSRFRPIFASDGQYDRIGTGL